MTVALAAEEARPGLGAGSGAGASPSLRVQAAWAVLQGVLDPEVPALSVCDLGIVRDVRELDDGRLEVVLTPTYSGCPATEVIERGVVEALEAAGLGPVVPRLQRAPAWTTDWISDAGRRKLREYGIAPPGATSGGIAPPGAASGSMVPPGAASGGGATPIRIVRRAASPVACPRCGSVQTECLSAFGSTACKALYRCLDCREPFEHFKPI